MSSQDKMTQYINFSPHQWFEPKTTAQTKQQKKKIQNLKKPTITIISDLNSNCQLPKPGDRSNTHKTCWKCCINTERPTGQKKELLDGRTVENKGKLILLIYIATIVLEFLQIQFFPHPVAILFYTFGFYQGYTGLSILD